jgi:hypothetical protein
LMLLTAIALFAALAIPVQLGAQNKHQHKHQSYQFVDLGTFGGPSSYYVFTSSTLDNHGVEGDLPGAYKM